MSGRAWFLVVVAGGGLLAACAAALFLAQTVPGVARLVRGAATEPVAPATLRPTFTPALATATLTPTPTTSPSPLPSATAPAAPTETVAVPATALPATATALPPATVPPAASPPPEPTPWSQGIVFETRRGALGDYEIFMVAPDGSGLTNLTNSWADDVAPVWSPDGRRIAFLSFRDTLAGKFGLGNGSIYIMGFDPASGAGETYALTGGEANDGWPTWSPDSRRVAFESDRSGNWDIWIANLDGSGLVNLTRSPEDERFPAWSPDGKTMAFTSERSDNWEVWVLDVEASLNGPGNTNPRNLTKNPARDRYAMWSPDGRQITFNTNRDDNQEIYVMNADGSKPANVSRSPESIEGLADWSPDGRRVVLYSDRPGNKDLFVVDLATGQWTNITKNPASDEFCTWSP